MSVPGYLSRLWAVAEAWLRFLMGPEDRVTLDESVSIAMLALLASLGPAERSALMLRDVLGLPYDEVSEVLGRSQAAPPTRHQGADPHTCARASIHPDRAQHTEAVRAFLAACSHRPRG